jgi:hypothetical protein
MQRFVPDWTTEKVREFCDDNAVDRTKIADGYTGKDLIVSPEWLGASMDSGPGAGPLQAAVKTCALGFQEDQAKIAAAGQYVPKHPRRAVWLWDHAATFEILVDDCQVPEAHVPAGITGQQLLNGAGMLVDKRSVKDLLKNVALLFQQDECY